MTSTDPGGAMLTVSPSGSSPFRIRRYDTLYCTALATDIISKAQRLIDTLQNAYGLGLTTAAESESIISALDTLAKSYGAKRMAIADALLPLSGGSPQND